MMQARLSSTSSGNIIQVEQFSDSTTLVDSLMLFIVIGNKIIGKYLATDHLPVFLCMALVEDTC
jgi:hypothetical protein